MFLSDSGKNLSEVNPLIMLLVESKRIAGSSFPGRSQDCWCIIKAKVDVLQNGRYEQ
jgi:hypothetical protein